ncbi:MAG: MmcQ/YjbR family DNA-binding protein [Actinobacteria bacterium]|nr:MmcQ/YjbR family DNA-binding protein [Actinomycetota bacterium]
MADRAVTDSSDPIVILTEVCLAFPGAELKPFADHEAPSFRVRDKIFVMVHETLDSFMCKAPPGVQALLVEQEPERFFVPRYTGHNGWIGVRLVDVDRDELRGIALDSYKMTAPKRLQMLLSDEDRGRG